MIRKLAIAVCAAALFGGAAQADREPDGRRGKPLVQVQSGVGLDLTVFPFGGEPSTGTLLRERDRVTFNGSFRALAPDSAYSMWWMVFNQPELCAADCTLPDIEAGVGQIFYAGGFTTDADGLGQGGATLPVGRIPQGAARFSEANDFDSVIIPESEVGLRRPFDALVLVAVRNHGPVNPEILSAQIGTYTAGCAQYEPEGDGDFQCFDEQAVAFQPLEPERRWRRW